MAVCLRVNLDFDFDVCRLPASDTGGSSIAAEAGIVLYLGRRRGMTAQSFTVKLCDDG